MSLETSIVLRVKRFQESYFGASEKKKLVFIKNIFSITPLAFSLKKHPSFPVFSAMALDSFVFSGDSFGFYVISIVTLQKSTVWKILEMSSDQKEHLLLYITVNENMHCCQLIRNIKQCS